MAEQNKSTNTKTKTDKEVSLDTKKPKSSKGWIWILVGAVLFAIVVAAYFLFFAKTNIADDPKNSPSYSDSFFIYANGKYSLWNKDGVRLSPDEYDAKSDFVGGYAYVRKEKEYAIIDASGRVMVPFGQISEMIDSYAGLFLIKDNNGARRLVTGTNRELLAGDGLEIDSPSLKSAFLVAELDNRYYIYDYTGKRITDFEKVDDKKEIEYSTSNDFALVYYNESNLLLDTRTGSQLAFFNGVRFEINDVSEDRTAVLLADANDDDKDNLYKLVKGGVLYDLGEMQYYGMVRGTNYIVGYDDSFETVALLDDNYRVQKKVTANIALKDANNYALETEDGKVEIYQGGNLVKTFDKDAELVSSVLYDANLYAIKADEKYGFYRLDGSYAFGEYSDISSLFDKKNHASVSDDGKSYYMIDTNGKRLSDVTYSRIYGYDHSYLVRNDDGKRAILGESGQALTGFDYDEAYNRSVAVDHEIWSLKKDTNKSDVFDAITGKMIVTDVNPYDFYANYFTVKNSDDKKEFYTYSGYKFYAE